MSIKKGRNGNWEKLLVFLLSFLFTVIIQTGDDLKRKFYFIFRFLNTINFHFPPFKKYTN